MEWLEKWKDFYPILHTGMTQNDEPPQICGGDGFVALNPLLEMVPNTMSPRERERELDDWKTRHDQIHGPFFLAP